MKALAGITTAFLMLIAVCIAAWMVQYKIFDDPYDYKGRKVVHRVNRFTGEHQILDDNMWIKASDWELKINELGHTMPKTKPPPRLTPTLPPLSAQSKPVLKVNRGKEPSDTPFEESETAENTQKSESYQ